MTSPELIEFRERIGEIQDLSTAQGLLGWDLEVMMPEHGADIRAKQLSTLAKLTHEMMTAPRLGELITHLRLPAKFSELDKIDQALVRETHKDYDRAHKLPVSLVQEMTETAAKAHHLWVEARKTNQFSLFAPILEKHVELARKMADYYGYTGSPYNALMDLYEPDLTTDIVDSLFSELKKALVPLVKAIADSSVVPDTSFLNQYSDIEQQRAWSEYIIDEMGFEMGAGRLDKAPHPFCMGMGPGDVRLTTRYFEEELISSLFSAMHEAGHGLYEQGVDPALSRTSLSQGASLGIHESQSRLWENLVGRSKAFWTHYYPQLQHRFAEQLRNVRMEQFYAAINLSRPSLIRVESDEVTYNLHIMVRYEIEKDLIEGRLAVKDVPAAWDAKMEEYLGLTPPNDSQGCLQDVHWSHGSFGYFPTYTLGNLYSVQFFNTAKKQMPSLEKDIASGNLKPLKTWLNQQIHWVSKVESPAEIVQRVTGEPLNAHYFVAYLWEKFAPIYNLQIPAGISA